MVRVISSFSASLSFASLISDSLLSISVSSPMSFTKTSPSFAFRARSCHFLATPRNFLELIFSVESSSFSCRISLLCCLTTAFKPSSSKSTLPSSSSPPVTSVTIRLLTSSTVFEYQSLMYSNSISFDENPRAKIVLEICLGCSSSLVKLLRPMRFLINASKVLRDQPECSPWPKYSSQIPIKSAAKDC